MSEAILRLLQPMKDRAREDGLMFQHTGMHREVRFTPGRLDEMNADGKFLWGPVNWRLEPMSEAERMAAMLEDIGHA